MLKQTSKPATLCQATMASESTTDTFSSPIHRSGLSLLGASWVECYMTLALSSDLGGNSTKMEELITMCFATLKNPSQPETKGSSTLKDIIRTSKQYEELLEKHGNTLARTGMFSWMIHPLSPLSLGEVLKESATTCGLRSQMQQVVTSFLRLARRWLREISSVRSALFPNTQTGSSDQSPCPTPAQWASPVRPETPEPSQVSRNGYWKISRTPEPEWEEGEEVETIEELLRMVDN